MEYGGRGISFYHGHCLELLACGDNKKQTNFSLGLLLFLNSLQTLCPLVADTWADVRCATETSRCRAGPGGGDGGKHVASSADIRVNGSSMHRLRRETLGLP